MNPLFPGGVWPVMITPYTADGAVDYDALTKLVDWYIASGVSGLFADCQSSEIFRLSLEERVRIAETTVKAARGRVPVIASGHISDRLEDQAAELNAIAKTGVQALILISNRLAAPDESDTVWLERLHRLLSMLETDLPLGFYECPYPYKRLLTRPILEECIRSGRFHFVKDTCCDIALIRERLKLLETGSLRLYNANTTTLLESLREGAVGYCGVMANFHPEAYVWLCEHFRSGKADDFAKLLSLASLIERQLYPVNAKYHLSAIEGLPLTCVSRVQDAAQMTDVFRTEVRWMDDLIHKAMQQL